MMQRQVHTIKRVQNTTSSTQVPYIDKDVDAFLAMRDKHTDEEPAHEQFVLPTRT